MMKIATFSLDVESGKYKYSLECFEKLIKKFEPKKTVYYTVEFIGEDFESADAVIFDIKKRFDFVFIDIEKITKRIERSGDPAEKEVLLNAQRVVEGEEVLCDHVFSPEEHNILANLSLVTYKPCLGADGSGDINLLIEKVLVKTGRILFFTAAKKELRAWDVKKGSSVVAAAARVHSDLARGFIQADVINCKDIDNFFNMAEARARGFVQSVGKEYIVSDGDIIEVKFNV
ncbi:MAG: DUF933 domain-containing protein [Candidatus Omnitrophota bacterium]